MNDLPVELSGPTLSFDALLRVPATLEPRADGYALRFELKTTTSSLGLGGADESTLSALRGSVKSGTSASTNQVDLSAMTTIATTITRATIADPGSTAGLTAYADITGILDERIRTIEQNTDNQLSPTPTVFVRAIQAAIMNQILTDQAYQKRIANKLTDTLPTNNSDATSDQIRIAEGFSTTIKKFVTVVDELLGDAATDTAKVFSSSYINTTTIASPSTYTGGAFAPTLVSFTDTDTSATIGGSIVVAAPSVKIGISSYNIYFGGATNSTSRTSLLTNVSFNSSGTDTAFSVSSGTALPAGTTRFWVYPLSDSTEVDMPNWAGIINIESTSSSSPPSAPSTISATSSTGATAVTWSSVSGATSYNLYWSTTTPVSKSSNKIANATSPYSHASLTSGSTYYYRVTAVNTDGESSVSSEASATLPQYLTVTNGQDASVVIGQPDFTTATDWSTTSQSRIFSIYTPGIEVTPSGALFITDTYNNRVLVYNSIPTTNGANASYVIGQSSWATATSTSANGEIKEPLAASYDPTSGKFVLVDSGYKRVLIYNSIPADTGATGFVASSPAVAVGVANLTSAGAGTAACTATNLRSATDAFAINGKLLIADNNGSRVFIYNSIPSTSGAAPDLVLGQANATTCGYNGSITGSSISSAYSIWSDGTRLVIAAPNNHRVMIWNSWPTADNQPADLVLGQADLTSVSANRGGSAAANTLNLPFGVYSNGTQLFVADTNNNRVLIWNSFPTTNGQPADAVLGQPNFTSTAYALTRDGMRNPYGIRTTATKIIVTDGEWGRIMVYVGQ